MPKCSVSQKGNVKKGRKWKGTMWKTVANGKSFCEAGHRGDCFTLCFLALYVSMCAMLYMCAPASFMCICIVMCAEHSEPRGAAGMSPVQ